MDILTSFLKFCLIFCLFATVGCESYDPQPELKDPIYNEFTEKAQSSLKEIETIDKILEQNNLDLETDNPRGIRRLGLIADNERLELEKRQFMQKKQYFTIKARKRAKYVRSRVLASINAKRNGYEDKVKLWDMELEHEIYQTNQRLRQSPRDWSHRVPKLNPEEEF